MPTFDPDQIYPTFDELIPGENPLSDSGRWGSYHTRPPLMVRDTGGSIHGTLDGPVCGSLYRQQAFQGDDVSAYGCRPDSGLGAALESNRIVALYGDPNAYNGYSSGFGGGIGEYYFFRKYTNFAFLGIGGPPGQLYEPGGAPGPNKLGIRILPDRVEQWASNAGFNGGEFFLVQTAFDTTFRGPVRFALETEEQGGIEEVGWTCFGAGVKNNPEFLTWLPASRVG